jgi:hypothetical protein
MLYLLPIAHLVFTDTKITKSIYTDQYYAKVKMNEHDFNVFVEYMEENGWTMNPHKQMGSIHVFEKNGVERRVASNSVKTIIIDGKLNL